MANLSQKIKENPLQALTVGIAVVGVAFSIFNFYLLANIAPLERRVVAIEERNRKTDPLVNEFIEQKGDIKAIKNDIMEIKQDLRELRNRLVIR